LLEATDTMEKYRKMISDGINFIRSGAVKVTDQATYILGKNRIPETLIGTITSIALNSGIVDRSKPLLGFAETSEDMVKVSARAAEKLDINLREVIVEAAVAVGGEGGGHRHAAGALIPKGKEKEFINAIDSILSKVRIDGKENKG